MKKSIHDHGRLSAALLMSGVAAGSVQAQFEDRPPTPPRYEAVVLDEIEAPPPYNINIWEPWSMADDGTVYGFGEDQRQTVKQMFKARAESPTEWLWKREPIREHWRPERANVDGYVLLENVGESRPRSWVFDPRRGEPVDVYRFYPTGLSLGDLNNHNVAAGTVDILVPEDFFKAATVDLRGNVNIIGGPGTVGVEINDLGTVHALAEQAIGFSRYRVWHADGDVSEFTVPTESFIGTKAMNNRDEVVGIRMWLDDLGRFRQGGWYWSRSTGVVEIPFWHTDEFNASDMLIYGISDDGWVFGREDFSLSGGEVDQPGHFLWRPDTGFFALGDLYDWEDQFYFSGAFGGDGAANAPGQLVLQNVLLSDPEFHYRLVFLDPLPTPMLRLTPDPLRGNQPATFDVTDGEPGQTSGLYYSLTGRGETYVPELDLTLELANAIQIGNLQTTDETGATSWTAPIPNVPGRRDVWFQVAQKESQRLSIPHATQVRP